MKNVNMLHGIKIYNPMRLDQLIDSNLEINKFKILVINRCYYSPNASALLVICLNSPNKEEKFASKRVFNRLKFCQIFF